VDELLRRPQYVPFLFLVVPTDERKRAHNAGRLLMLPFVLTIVVVDLRDHLAKVFGVSSLFEAATITKGMADRAASGLRKLKSTRRIEKREREQLHAELQSTDVCRHSRVHESSHGFLNNVAR
jgi:hypothetical protein